ncbi:MAG TPA: hypothetical protein DCL61_21910 [Cyanobacteria bacterium UBA12227]|nr:hypothetical protein [Cyanobacteria bacterium UBA12227]
MSLSIRHWLAERHIQLAQLGHPNAQISGIAFRIAQDMESKSLDPFAISVVTEVLELPFNAAWQVTPAISQLTVGLLRILSRKKPLRRNEGTWLTFQVAYLNALQGILEQESQLRRPWVNRAEVPAPLEADELLAEPQLIGLIKTLRPGRLTDSQAEQALSMVADSFLVKQMNNLAIAWFVANGAEETEANLLTQRLSNGLAGYLLTAIAENPLPLAQLQKFVRLGNLAAWRDPASEASMEEISEFPPTTLPLDLDREYYRAGLLRDLSEPLFAEPFALKDLYVPLKGKPIHPSLSPVRGNFSEQPPTNKGQQPDGVDLMEWVTGQLEDKTSIAVIEADAGCGKTSFCQILAAHVAGEFYPNWMPVLIRLRDVTLGQTLEQTLETAFPIGRFTDTDGWLSPNSPPCLLILDGLNELPRSPQTERHLVSLMDQVLHFHTQKVGATGFPRHKILLTSRSATLDSLLARNYRQSVALPLSAHLRRIAIEPLGQDEFRQWFQQWAKLQSKSIAQTYFNFLKHGGVFQKQPPSKELAALLTRPLMLYLVGILHRDTRVDESIFQMHSTQVKFEIYDRVCRWLLGEPATDSGPLPELIREGLAHASRSLEAIANLLDGRHPQQLRHQMQVAALTIIQTGQCQATPAAIQNRLDPNSTTDVLAPCLPAFFFRSLPRGWGEGEIGRGGDRERGRWGSASSISSRTISRYTSPPHPLPPSSPPLRLEFSHPSLGEYLGAEEIALQLKALTQQVPDQYGEVIFAIDSPSQVAEHLYQLLGYGLLSDEIEELVMERLRREEKRNADSFSFNVLFKRLYRFYRTYCRGRWLDEGIAHQVYTQLRALQNPLNGLQIDATVGINVFLLLCAGARAAKVPFWPCGNPEIPQEFDADQLVSFIGRTVALSPTAFWQRVRHSLSQIHLTQACLNGVMLAEANLSQAHLSAAELMGVNLVGANLRHTHLVWANLAGANLSHGDLCGANLEGANLSGADLRGANFTSANLTNACLFEAQLDEQNRNFAIRSGAIFSREEFQVYKKSLVAQNLTKRLEEDALLEEEPTIFIESAEGEPILPEIRYTHGNDDYEGETAQLEDWEAQKAILQETQEDSSEYEETIIVEEALKEES